MTTDDRETPAGPAAPRQVPGDRAREASRYGVPGTDRVPSQPGPRAVSWYGRTGIPVNRAQIREWKAEVDARSDADRTGVPGRAEPLLPGISVVVTAHGTTGDLAVSLDRLARQTLDGRLYELIVVLADRPRAGRSRELAERFRADWPSVQLRVVRLLADRPLRSTPLPNGAPPDAAPPNGTHPDAAPPAGTYTGDALPAGPPADDTPPDAAPPNGTHPDAAPPAGTCTGDALPAGPPADDTPPDAAPSTETRADGSVRARNAGIVAARREYTTFIDAADLVSPTYLDMLLTHARPEVTPLAEFVDAATGEPIPPGGSGPPTAPDAADAADAAAEATTRTVGKAVSTRLLKRLLYDLRLDGAPDAVFWTAAAVHGRLEARPCRAGEGAIYYRRRGDATAPADPSGDGNATVAAPDRTPSLATDVVEQIEVISRLDRLAAVADPGGRRLVRAVVAGRAGCIGEYLLRHPEQRQRVVDALDRHPVADLPYDRINKAPARGLVLAYAFPPYADASAIVAAKRLRERGEAADVIYNAMDAIRPVDPSSTLVPGPYLRRSAALRTPTHFDRWKAMEEFAGSGLETIRRWVAAEGPYEWMYSRAGFPASHLLAAAHKLACPEVAWTAEFSDPLSRDVSNQERGNPVATGPLADRLRTGLAAAGLPVPASTNSLVWCEEITYALADTLVFTNENQREHMLGYCSDPHLATLARSKAVVSPHPTLPDRFYRLIDHPYPLGDGVVNLAYFGKFYPRRGLDDVMAALARLSAGERQRIRLHLFARKSRALRQRAAEMGVTDCVRLAPYVSYLEFLNLTTKFDCLIVNDVATVDTHTRNPYLPSKWSDYRGSGTPVWGLVEAGSPLSGQPLDHVSPIGDLDAIEDVLTRLVSRKQVTGPAAGQATAGHAGTVRQATAGNTADVRQATAGHAGTVRQDSAGHAAAAPQGTAGDAANIRQATAGHAAAVPQGTAGSASGVRLHGGGPACGS